MDPDADLHLVLGDLEERRAARRRRAGGQRDAHRADVGDDLVSDAHELVEVSAVLGRGADRLDDEEVARHASAADRPRRVLDRHVVVDEQGLDPHALGFAEFAAHLERGPVAGVVVDDVEDAHLRVHELRRLDDEVHRRAREDVARAGGVEHALADDHRVRRLVARAGALDDRHLVVARRVRAVDQVVLRLVLQGAVAGKLDALEELGDELLRIVQELLHKLCLTSRASRAKRR